MLSYFDEYKEEYWRLCPESPHKNDTNINVIEKGWISEKIVFD